MFHPFGVPLCTTKIEGCISYFSHPKLRNIIMHHCESMDYEVKSIKIREKQIKSQKETEEDDGLKKNKRQQQNPRNKLTLFYLKYCLRA